MKKILLSAFFISMMVCAHTYASVYLFDLSNIAPTVPASEYLTLLDADSTSTTIITGGNGRLYRSTNEGASWSETQPAGNVDKNWSIASMSSDGSIILAGVSGGRLYLSTDSGASWSETQPAGNVDKNWSIASMSSDGSIILAGVSGGRLYLSTDSGSSWSETQPAGNVDKNWGAVSVGDDGSTMLAGVSGGRLYLSTDSGSSWSETQPAGNTDKDWRVVSAPIASGSGYLILAGVYGGGMYKTLNEGTSWSAVTVAGTTNQNWTIALIQYDGDRVIVGAYDGHIYASDGSLSAWRQIDSGSSSGWTRAVINSDDNNKPLLAVNTTKNLFAGTVGVPTDPVITLVANGENEETLSGNTIYHTTEVQRSSDSIFGRPHGNVTIGDKIYIGTATNPAKIIEFSNQNDLSVYDSVTINASSSFATMIYDELNNRIYATALVGSGKLTIYSFNPDNIHDYQVVFASPSITNGNAPALATDGVYVYGATYTAPSVLFKIRISDWTLVSSTTWSGVSDAHAGKAYRYNDRTEIYITSAPSGIFIKVNGNDLSYTQISLNTGIVTDDMVFRYIDESGGIVYAGSEVENKGYAIDTRSMSVTEFFAPRTYGMFSDGANLYSASIDGYILKFPHYDIAHPVVSKFFNEIPNEIFITSTGKTFFTVWETNSYLKEYAMSESPKIMSAQLDWTEEIPGVYFTLEISTNGVDYVTVNRPTADIYDASFVFSELLPETTYWVRITASNAGARDSNPVVYSFTTPGFTRASTQVTSSSQSGTTLKGRYTNLVNMGKQSEALAVLNEFTPSPTKATRILFEKNLKYGMQSPDVQRLQEFLNSQGYLITKEGAGSPGKETMRFGLLTKQALARFQKAHSISPAVGYFGPVTRALVNTL